MYIKFILLTLCVTISSIWCMKCPLICTADYRPICARSKAGNEVTFSNPCTLGVKQCLSPIEEWTKISDGTCSGDVICCGRGYDPKTII